MRQPVFHALLVFALSGCATKEFSAHYDANAAGPAGWYPIPSDAPASVSSKDLVMPRVNIDIPRPDPTVARAPLTVERLTDSIGNVSLRLNRPTNAAWELVSVALDSEKITVDDRDRNEYRFDLLKQKKGFFGFFKGDDETLSLVLVPDNGKTLIVLEGKDDVTPDSEHAAEVIDSLYQYFETNS